MYLSALRHQQIALGHPEPDHPKMPKLKVVSNGIARARAQSTPSQAQQTRLPITPHILRGIKQLWSHRKYDPDIIMLWAACTTAFFGFFRLGELITPSAAAFDPTIHLTPADVAIDNRANPSLVEIHLKISKTDQERKGVSVYLGKTDDDLCPVAAVSAFLAVRGRAPGPFFRFQNLSPLTKDTFIKHVRAALSTLGYNPRLYAGHSFRIGAATTAAENGLEDSTIKALGRWESDAFQAYVKIPRDRLASFSRTLSSPTNTTGLPCNPSS